ncbi:RHS repeat domain-containing protein [Nevskia soli]|uniref:RHS repeat domain-containing protein n=1 Tax=Nevskia soli TaxID=418856 RepID=UPI0004A753A3
MGYDALDRLISASGAYGAYTYAYDAAGNRISETIAAGTISPLLSFAGSSATGLNYNAVGQVAGISRNGASIETNLYDGAHHRIEKDMPMGIR